MTSSEMTSSQMRTFRLSYKTIPTFIVLSIWSLSISSVPSFAADAKAAAGANLFKSHCILCHGTDASGNTPVGRQMKARNLRSADVQKQTDAELKNAIMQGKGNMPPFSSQLTGVQIDNLLAYIRQLVGARK